MPQSLATLVYGCLILALFLSARERESRVSSALWIPVAWVSIGASRTLAQWFYVGPTMVTPDEYLEGSALDRFILTGFVVSSVMVLIARGRRVGKVLGANGPIILFFLYGAMSVLWSDYADVAFKRWVKAFGNFMMVMVVLTDRNPSVAVKELLKRTGFLLIPLSILLIKYYPHLGRAFNPWVWEPYNTGVATDKNGLGCIALVFGLGSLWRLLEAFRNDERPRQVGPLVAHGVVLAMALYLFHLAHSATSLACFLLGGSLIALMGLRGFARRPAVAHFLVVGTVFLSLFGLFLGGTDLVEAMGRDTTLTGRTGLWQELLNMNVDPWFGTGFESFWLGERAKVLWAHHWWHPNQAHNGYLEVFLNLGWLGVALLSLLMVWGYRNVVGALHRHPELGRLRLALFVVALLYNMTEATFKVMHPVWIAFLLAVAAVPEPRVVRTGEALR